MSLKDIPLDKLKKIAKHYGINDRGTKKQLYDRINYHLRKTQSGGRVMQRKPNRKIKQIPRTVSKRKTSRKRSYFKRGNTLSEPHERYCRCLLHVADQQSAECLRGKKWNERVNGKECYNPYAVCSKSTKRKGFAKCSKNYNINNIPKSELQALLRLKGVSLSEFKKKYLDVQGDTI